MTVSDWVPLNRMGFLESSGSDTLGPAGRGRCRQSGLRGAPQEEPGPEPPGAWPLWAGSRGSDLPPSPLRRVKFLLMDARGSPQAETRWSDPIALHQGSPGGGGTALAPAYPCRLVTPCHHNTREPRDLDAGSKSSPSSKQKLVQGRWGTGSASLAETTGLSLLKCCQRSGAQVPAQSWAEAAFPSNASPGPSPAGGEGPGHAGGQGQSQGRGFWEISLSRARDSPG